MIRARVLFRFPYLLHVQNLQAFRETLAGVRIFRSELLGTVGLVAIFC